MILLVGEQLDQMILEVFSNLNVSMVHRITESSRLEDTSKITESNL